MIPRQKADPAKFTVRLTPEQHAELRAAAKREGVSVNVYVIYKLATELAKKAK